MDGPGGGNCKPFSQPVVDFLGSSVIGCVRRADPDSFISTEARWLPETPQESREGRRRGKGKPASPRRRELKLAKGHCPPGVKHEPSATAAPHQEPPLPVSERAVRTRRPALPAEWRGSLSRPGLASSPQQAALPSHPRRVTPPDFPRPVCALAYRDCARRA